MNPPRIVTREVPPRPCFALEQAGVHPLLARLLAARGVRAADELDDLVRVMHVLDGRPEPDHRDGMYRQLSRAVPMHDGQRFPRECVTDFVAVRLFRNGNGHALFRRPDLVDRMNLILAKHYPGALPEPV